MNTHRAVRILSVLLLVSATFVAAVPAYADTHVQEVYEIDVTITRAVGDPDSPIPCDFEYDEHIHGVLRVNLWLDENDRRTREVEIYGNLKSDWSANGKIVKVLLQGPVHTRVEYYPDKIVAITTITGPIAKAVIPHYGSIYGGAGQITFTTTYTPEWEFISGTFDKGVGSHDWDWGPICAYLGQAD